jgi:hypothetical protein
MSVIDILTEVEAAGIALRVHGEKIRIRFPQPEHRSQLASQVAFLRAHRDEVATFLRQRAELPTMPSGTQLLEWNLKTPPVLIESCAIVTDPALFARTTISQLGLALADPRRWVGWTIPQLIERLAQVGVAVALESVISLTSPNGTEDCR